MDIDELTQQVVDHLAQKPVVIRWQSPPSETAVGQLVKTPSGQLIVYVSPNLTSLDARWQVLLHEVAHARLDADFVPVSDDHTQPGGSVKQSEAARAAWRVHPRESRAERLAIDWLQYADQKAYKYWRAGRDKMTCRLLALLDWRE